MSDAVSHAEAYLYALRSAGLEGLSDAELAIALHDFDFWLRPEQRVPRKRFGSFGVVAGRGWGKTTGIANEINRRVECGEARAVGLMAPNEDRVDEVQIQSLVRYSVPWFRPEPYAGTVRWPNGLVAEVHTAMQAGRTRSSNFDCVWLTELCDWQHTTRLEAHDNITTACREHGSVIFWDTTSKGKNDVIQKRIALSNADPEWHILRRGDMFDNRYLDPRYLADEMAKYTPGTRRYDEEVLGKVFLESAGALWRTEWLDPHRRHVEPSEVTLELCAWDPALSDSPDADEQGLCRGVRGRDGHAYVLEDWSRRADPSDAALWIVQRCVAGCAGVVVERNHAGNMPRGLLRLHAAKLGMRVQLLQQGEPFRRTPGVIYVREYTTHDSKQVRAHAPAAAYAQGRVHHVGDLADLEAQQTTWEPGSGRSPNRLDAGAYLVTDLLDLETSAAPPDGAGAIAGAAKVQAALPASRGGGLGL